jgi:hypothetical protein
MAKTEAMSDRFPVGKQLWLMCTQKSKHQKNRDKA